MAASTDSVTQVSVDGTLFIGNDFADIIKLPTNYTNPDGTPGGAINWSGSMFTVDGTGVLTGAAFTAVFNAATTSPAVEGSFPGVTISLPKSATATLQPGSGRWYLREDVNYNGNRFLCRRIVVSGEL